MLILTRYIGEKIMIGDDVDVTILGLNGDQVKIGINAPKEVAVHRKEIYQRIQREIRLVLKINKEGNVMGLDDIFKFGKHEGQQLEDVIEDDPSYIAWLANHEFNFNEEVLELIAKKKII